MREYIMLFWPEMMYKSFEKGISSYYKTGLDDDYSWSKTPVE